MLNTGFPLFFARLGALGLLLGCLAAPASASDRSGSVYGIVPVSATIVGSSGVIRPITTPLILSVQAMMSGASLELPRAGWLRSTGPADVASALMVAGSPDVGTGSQRVRSESLSSAPATTTTTTTSSVGSADGARGGQTSSPGSLGLAGGRGGAVLVSRVDRRTPGYVSLAMTYE